MAKTARVPDKKIIEAIRAIGPFISEVARSLSMKPNTLYHRVERTKKLQEVMDEERDAIVDISESNVWKGVKAGDKKDSKYILDRLGKNRGYTTRAEIIDLSENKHITVTPDLSGFTADELKKFMEGLANAANAITDSEAE